MSFEEEFVIMTCCTCGVQFALREAHWLSLYQSGNGYFCPNGHEGHYIDPDADDDDDEGEEEPKKPDDSPLMTQEEFDDSVGEIFVW